MFMEARPHSSQPVPKTQPRSPDKLQQQDYSWDNYTTSHQQYMEDNFPLEKLDLIFKKEPKEIQNKIVQLLLRYNANMLYNKESDMFEVDLLIPFQNQEQKRQFIRQFLAIRRQQHSQQGNNHKDETELPEKQRNQEIEWIGEYQDNRKFSFNSKGIEEEGTVPRERTSSKGNVDNSSQGSRSPFQPPEDIKKEEPLNLELLREVSSRRLKNAVEIIKAEQKINQHELDWNEPPKEESIIDQIANSISLGSTEKIGESKLLNLSGSKEEVKADPPANVYYSKEEETLHYRKPIDFNYQTEQPYYNEIVEEVEEDQYEPLFEAKAVPEQPEKVKKTAQEGRAIAFEDYARKYASIKETKQNKSKAIVQSRRHPETENKHRASVQAPVSYSSQRNPVKSTKRKKSDSLSYSVEQTLNRSKRDLQQYYQKSNKEIEIFFHTYRKSLDKLYADVRERIERNAPLLPASPSTIEKSLDDLYIYILDEQPSEPAELASAQVQTRTFKEEMIKEYQRQIILMNRNLSSQDLVTYFKYLHSNAYKLYLRYLKNKIK